MEDTLEMLSFIYKNAEMGYLSSNDLLTLLKEKNNKIKKDLDTITAEYKNYMDKSKKIIKKSKFSLPSNSLFTKVSSKMGMKMELNKDNSDSSIASMLIQGLTMGEISMEAKISSYKNSLDKNILNFAEEYKAFQQKYIEMLKKYL